MRNVKQLFCIHWFDPPISRQYSESSGPIICAEQRTYTITNETRICSKCNFTDSRQVGEPIYEGWT